MPESTSLPVHTPTDVDDREAADRPLDDVVESEDDSLTLPPLLRRPAPVPAPAPLPRLRRPRTALLDHPRTNLDLDAASCVVSGSVNPEVIQALLENRRGGAAVSLLTEKPVGNGVLYALPPHRRYLDLDILPDLLNGRWKHLLRTMLDPSDGQQFSRDYTTVVADVEDGHGGTEPQHLAVLTIHLPDRAALISAVTTSLRKTYDAEGGKNDYSTSILQSGVKEPLLLFVLRVTYDTGDAETFLMAGDGNSRLVSAWKARSSGDIDATVALFIATVLGGNGSAPHDRRAARRKVDALASRVNRGLGERKLTEQTVRDGHTTTIPATVIVGAFADSDAMGPMTDLVAAKDELVSGLHVNVTPWAEAAQYDQGMARVLRRATTSGLLANTDEADVMRGVVTTTQMADRLEVPAHRLWAVAVYLNRVLRSPGSRRWHDLIREEFGLKAQSTRQQLGARLGAAALAPYRSLDPSILSRALNAFADGGVIADVVWGKPWTLTRGSHCVDVLNTILDRALADDTSARAELAVLGGTAAILDGLLTRDRGSKLGTEREVNKTPYRSSPHRVLNKLAASEGGLRTLHSIALAHVTADPAVLPKQFHTITDDEAGTVDGAPVVDGAGAHVTIDYEWDVYAVADPVLTAEVLREAAAGGPGGRGTDNRPEDEKARTKLKTALKEGRSAVATLTRLYETHGTGEVFGTPAFVRDCRKKIRAMDDALGRYGPADTSLATDDEDEDDVE